jgi:hypothetical protein
MDLNMALIRDTFERALFYAAKQRKDFKLRNRKLRLHPEFVETKSIFIHIPKTAGYSVALALYGRDPWHFTLSEYETILDPKDYFTFTVVREPAKRLLSMYSYYQKLKRFHPDVRPLVQAADFSEFLDIFHTYNPRSKRRFLIRQTDYLKNTNGEIAIDFIGKMENLPADFKTIQQAIDLPDAVLQHLNKSDSKKKTISHRDQQFVEKHFAEEYELLGY